jgi:outer membrane protein TolC
MKGAAIVALAFLLTVSQARAQSALGPFSGSVPVPATTADPVVLTLASAVEQGMAHNLGLLTAQQKINSANGARWKSLAGVLPYVSGQVSQATETTNLAAFGFDASKFPGLDPQVGPFNVFDARLSVSQPVIDVSAANDLKRATHELDASRLDAANARDVVALVVTDLYLRAATAANRIDAVRVEVTTAEDLVKLATQQHDAGVTPGIDVVRAQVQLRAQRQRLISAEKDFARQKIQLARAIGIPVGQPLELADREATVARPALSVAEALERAKASRPDYQAALARQRAAEADHRAASTDALPSLRVQAAWGMLGSSPSDAASTYSVAGVVRVPIFDAGRRKGRLIETAATLEDRRAAVADFDERIASDVRIAFLDVEAAEQQLSVSRERVDLAHQELTLAQVRFSAGVSSNLEVIQAQDEVAVANEVLLASSFAFESAKATLVRAIGSESAHATAIGR